MAGEALQDQAPVTSLISLPATGPSFTLLQPLVSSLSLQVLSVLLPQGLCTGAIPASVTLLSHTCALLAVSPSSGLCSNVTSSVALALATLKLQPPPTLLPTLLDHLYLLYFFLS